jgi:hypothetical protein
MSSTYKQDAHPKFVMVGLGVSSPYVLGVSVLS